MVAEKKGHQAPSQARAVTAFLWANWAIFSVIVVLYLWLRAIVHSAPFMGKSEAFMVEEAAQEMIAAAIVPGVAFLLSLTLAIFAKLKRNLSKPGIIALMFSALSIPGPILISIMWFEQR